MRPFSGDYTKEAFRAYIQLMSSMLSNPAIVEKEENFSVHGDAMLTRMHEYAIKVLEKSDFFGI
jgi:hypothetical protein